MNRIPHNHLSIGMFASAAQLSVKALRLYDRLGVLKPAYTDPSSGYRYYTTDQLDSARLIRMMRQMDMPLATIHKVLAADPDEAEQLVIDHWRELERRMAVARVTVQDLICALRGEPTMTVQTPALHVEARTLPTISVISITRHVTVQGVDSAILEGVAALEAFLKSRGIAPSGNPFGIFHGTINNDSDGPIEICLPTPELLNDSGDYAARMVTGGQAAFISLRDGQCAYPEVLKGYDALVDWMNQNGYEQASPPREEWATLPDIESQMNVYWLYRERK